MVQDNGLSTNFANFDMEDVTKHVGYHISGRTKVGGRPFASHLISTTDSFEAAINRAHRHLAKKRRKKRVSDIAIYVIDTYTLQVPALSMLMFLVFKAWNVASVLPQFKSDMFLYGALTEWIFFDRIVAKDVHKIDYASFAIPKRNSGHGFWRLHLEDLIPVHIMAARAEHSTKEGIPRSVLHAMTYHSQEQQKEIEAFADNAYVGRMSPLPKAPRAVREDTRCIVSDKVVRDVWSVVQDWRTRSLMLVWILSLMTKTYYSQSIAEAIARLYPEAIREQLHLVQDNSQPTSSSRPVLVYYRPGPNCHGRVDVNSFQELMEDCIYEWDKRKASDPDPVNQSADVFILTGDFQPMRNLIQLQEQGLLGRCTTVAKLEGSTENVVFPDFSVIMKYSRRVVQPTTSAEDYERLTYLYPNYLSYVPDFAGIGLGTMRGRPKNASATMGSRPLVVSESRLLSAKSKQPPPVPGSQTMVTRSPSLHTTMLPRCDCARTFPLQNES